MWSLSIDCCWSTSHILLNFLACSPKLHERYSIFESSHFRPTFRALKYDSFCVYMTFMSHFRQFWSIKWKRGQQIGFWKGGVLQKYPLVRWAQQEFWRMFSFFICLSCISRLRFAYFSALRLSRKLRRLKTKQTLLNLLNSSDECGFRPETPNIDMMWTL